MASSSESIHETPASRRLIFFIAIGIVFTLFVSRLIQLQVLYGEEYGRKSEENSIRPVIQEPIRGLMFDRNGILLVDNRPSYTVTITPSEFKKRTIPYLADILQVDSTIIQEQLTKGIRYNRFAPVKVKRDVDFATISTIEENRERLPGVDYLVEPKRWYPSKAKGTHLFGYTKEISDEQLQELSDEYRMGDNIGATGLEAAYERNLRGEKGYEFMTVNARGQVIGRYNNGSNDIPAKEGNELHLAIDANVQALAESLLADRRGAVVAIDPSDGGVIALVSKPDYDLTLFGGVTPPDVWNALNTDSTKPLFNRATLTRYPPGSTFKPVLAAAALKDGVINTNWRVQCMGSFRFGNHIFKDHTAHGSTNVVESIQRSCNVFYYTVMLKTGLERWTEMAKQFGFGAPTGIDILEETSGLLPSEAYFDRVYGKGRWTQGYLVSLAIGQGELGVSPLQMACYAATIGNRGYYHVPHVVESIRDKQTGQVTKVSTETRQIDLPRWIWNVLHEGMYRCVNEPGGTATLARVKGIDLCGKTGTAQNPHGKDHAWFIGYAPRENPKIAICVLVENAGFGGVISAPIAGMCVEQYLYGELVREKPREAVMALANGSTGNGESESTP
jgi:penicillin-binding protein 2